MDVRAGQLKKAEHQRTDVFKLLCWRRFLRVPWTARKSNHSILKEINPEYILEALMLKLKLQYFSSPDEKSWLIRKDPGAGKDGRWEKGTTEDEMVGWHHWLSGRVFEYTLGGGEGQRSLQFMELQRVMYNWITEQRQQWFLNAQHEDHIYHHYILDQNMLFYFSIQSVSCSLHNYSHFLTVLPLLNLSTQFHWMLTVPERFCIVISHYIDYISPIFTRITHNFIIYNI